MSRDHSQKGKNANRCYTVIVYISAVLPDPACGGSNKMKEEKEEMNIKKEFVVKEEEKMISKEEEVEEAICQTIVPCE